MAWRIFPNGASNYLSANINSSVTSVVLADASAFATPASGQEYMIRCDNEYMLVTAKSTNTLTVTRGQGGSTAASHTLGGAVYTVLTTDDIDKLSKQANLVTTSGAPASPTFTTPLQMAFDPATSRMYVWNGSAWKYVILT